jgi:5-methylcytosine-specific restriction endonuclease McrA
MEHRGLAQAKSGLTEAQRAGLALGSVPGTNHRTGYSHSEESKRKASETHKAWCAANPDKVKARGEKMRGDKHYGWNGGVSRLNIAIRQLTENRKWMDAVKQRDNRCLVCGSIENLESHHITPLAYLVQAYAITSREQARDCQALWDLSNGMTVCRSCHYIIHERTYAD